MKKTEYITGVVSIYRKYLDMYLNIPDKYNVDENDIKNLLIYLTEMVLMKVIISNITAEI